jgi:PAS domain S-box-containing protein
MVAHQHTDDQHSQQSAPQIMGEGIFRQLVEQSADAMVIIDIAGQIVLVNPRAESLFGYPREEMIGQPIELLMPERFHELHHSHRDRYTGHPIARAMGQGLDLWAQRRDGSEFPVAISLSPLDTDEGLMVLATVSDITESKQAEQSLRKSEQRFRQLVMQSADAIVMVTEQGQIVLANPSSAALFGYSQDELLSQPIEMLIPERFRTTHVAHRNHYAQYPGARSMGLGLDLRGRRRDASEFPVAISLSPIETDEGLMVLATISDITESRRAERALIEAEQRYREIVETAQEGIWIIDGEDTTTFVNSKLTEILGYSAEELLGKPSVFFLDDEAVALMQVYIERHKAGIKEQYDFRFRRKDGGIVWTLISSNPLFDEARTYAGVLRMVADITERKNAEGEVRRLNAELEHLVDERTDQLRESEEKFAKAFQVSPAAISIAILPEGRWIDVNEALIRMTGYSREELIGHTSAELGMVDLAARANIVEAIQTKGSVRDVEIQLHRKSGDIVDVLLSVENIELDGQRCELSIQYDITELKCAEREVRRLNADLEQRQVALQAANRELEAFSYSISHDLRAPLRAIDGFSRILIKDFQAELAPAAVRYLQLVRDSTQQMGQLVDDLLEFSRLSRQQPKKQSVDMEGLVRTTMMDLLLEYTERQVQVNIGTLPVCQADPILLKQVIVNLCSNALKFTAMHEVAQITVDSQQTSEGCVYSIADNGVGFDMRYVDKLFGVFQRLHRAEDFEGTGVGLAIVHRIIHRHGGRIWVESEVDKGTTFYFTLGEDVADD